MGGYERFHNLYLEAVPSVTGNYSENCYEPRQDSFHLFRDAITGDLPWPGLVFGLTIQATWYWCTDQVSRVKRAPAASYLHSRLWVFIWTNVEEDGRSQSAKAEIIPMFASGP